MPFAFAVALAVSSSRVKFLLILIGRRCLGVRCHASSALDGWSSQFPLLEIRLRARGWRSFPVHTGKGADTPVSPVAGDVAFHLGPLIFRLIAEVAELLLKFVELVAELHVPLLVVVAVFAQLSNQPVVVVHLLLLVSSIC